MVQYSYGVACFRKIDGVWNMLLVERRITSAFTDFILHPSTDITLFRGMNRYEKYLISSTNWKRVYEFSEMKIHGYNEFLRKVTTIPVNTLKEVIAHTSEWKYPNIEIPKGKSNGREKPYDVAIREFEEETGLSRDNYHVLGNNMYNVNYRSNGDEYQINYLLAIYDGGDVKGDAIDLNTPLPTERYVEILGTLWASKSELSWIIPENKREAYGNIFKKLKNIFKNELKK